MRYKRWGRNGHSGLSAQASSASDLPMRAPSARNDNAEDDHRRDNQRHQCVTDDETSIHASLNREKALCSNREEVARYTGSQKHSAPGGVMECFQGRSSVLTHQAPHGGWHCPIATSPTGSGLPRSN